MADQVPDGRTFEQIAFRAHQRCNTVEEAVTAALREAILIGVFHPGERLRQEHLADLLAVSRSPVTAALHTLQAEGLVVYTPNRGATVRVIEPEELEETYQLRIVLETFALRLAIERIIPADVDEMADLADQIDGEEDAAHRWELTDRFYQHVYTVAHCPLTAAIVGRLRADVGRYWLGFGVVPHQHSMYNVLMDAIRAGDSTRAEQWIAEHLTMICAELQQRMLANRQKPPL